MDDKTAVIVAKIRALLRDIEEDDSSEEEEGEEEAEEKPKKKKKKSDKKDSDLKDRIEIIKAKL